MRILVIGCGYVGLPLGARLAASGHEVYGMRRSDSAREELLRYGIRPLFADIAERSTLAAIEPDFDAAVNLVSSTRGGPEDYERVYLQGTRNVLDWLQGSSLAKFVYASSTSVYGQTDGGWVTEKSVTLPANATSRILLEAERELARACEGNGFPAVTVRIGGIYGPERGHLFRQFLRGEAAMRGEGDTFINGIHLDDVVGALAHLLTHGKAGAIYNAVDDVPVRQSDFFRWLSDTLHKPMPPSAPADPNRKRGVTNKRVSNEKLRGTGYEFVYPSFREGYTAEMRQMGVT